MFLRIPGSRGSPTKIAKSVEHVLQKAPKPWNVLQISLKPWNVLQISLKPWNTVLQILPKPWNSLQRPARQQGQYIQLVHYALLTVGHPQKSILQKMLKPWNKPVKLGGRWLVIKRFAFIRVIRGQKRFQKLQKPRNRANLSEFQNLRSRPGSELPKKMLTPWLSNS